MTTLLRSRTPPRARIACRPTPLGTAGSDFAVLQTLGALGGERRPAHIADALTEPLDTVERSLVSLLVSGLARQASDGRYSLTVGGVVALA